MYYIVRDEGMTVSCKFLHKFFEISWNLVATDNDIHVQTEGLFTEI